MSTIAKEQMPVKANPSDPRRDKDVLFYDKEKIGQLTQDQSSGAAELY